MTTLLIKPIHEKALELYSKHSHYNPGDSGLDLYILEDVDIILGETKFIDLGIQCEMIKNGIGFGMSTSFYLYPRSSFSKTPLVMGNHVGIIDAGYRGNLMAAIKYLPDTSAILECTKLIVKTTYYNSDNIEVRNAELKKSLPKYTIKAGTRLFQICAPNLEPFSFKLVDKLSATKRGTGGFGSTGK